MSLKEKYQTIAIFSGVGALAGLDGWLEFGTGLLTVSALIIVCGVTALLAKLEK